MIVAGPLMPLHRRYGAVPFALLALGLAAACATTPAPQAASPPPAVTAGAAAPAGPELPPLLRDLELTPAQMDEVLRVNADLERTAEPLRDAARELGHSVAGAVRQCKAGTPFMDFDGERVVREGEELRGPLLSGIQRVHRLLTPAQRRKVADRLLEGDDQAKRERSNSSRTRELGPALDLSTMQLMSMLVKAAVLWTSFADRVEPWRVRYHVAISNFAREDFDLQHEPVAAVPVAALTLEFVRAGLRLLVPLLEPKQCEVLARLIDENVDARADRAAQRAQRAAAQVNAERP